VKLLFDENLSRKLPARLDDLFGGSSHVIHVGHCRQPDITIWKFAGENGFANVSADADFYELAATYGPPPKIIWLRHCDYPTEVAEKLIRHQAIRVSEFLTNSEQGVLVLQPLRGL